MFQKNSKRTFTLYTSSNENGNNGKTGTELKSCLNTNKMLFPFSVPVFLSKQKREQLQNEKSSLMKHAPLRGAGPVRGEQGQATNPFIIAWPLSQAINETSKLSFQNQRIFPPPCAPPLFLAFIFHLS